MWESSLYCWHTAVDNFPVWRSFRLLKEHKSSSRPKISNWISRQSDRSQEVQCWQGKLSKPVKSLISAHYHLGSCPCPFGNVGEIEEREKQSQNITIYIKSPDLAVFTFLIHLITTSSQCLVIHVWHMWSLLLTLQLAVSSSTDNTGSASSYCKSHAWQRQANIIFYKTHRATSDELKIQLTNTCLYIKIFMNKTYSYFILYPIWF